MGLGELRVAGSSVSVPRRSAGYDGPQQKTNTGDDWGDKKVRKEGDFGEDQILSG